MLANLMLLVIWIGLTFYVLFAGADFGAGLWDLLAGGAHRGLEQRREIAHIIGPVWEANHVWLIFVIVLWWTGFPPVFAAVMSTLYIPLTLTALGIIARGAAFAFRKASATLAEQRLYGAFFALSSVLTPFFLGTVAGGIASGRVPPGIAAGNILTSWLNPTSVLGGVLAVLLCGYLAAVYLCGDATRRGKVHLAEGFRRRALVIGVLTGLVALGGIAVLRADAPTLFTGLTHRAFPLMVISALAGIVSLVLLVLRRYTAVRVTAAIAVAAVLWGWAVGQYPIMLQPGFTVADGPATPSVLASSLIAMAIGAVLLLPSLAWLLRLFQTAEAAGRPPAGADE